MYFNRKNAEQKNWRMIKKGKHFLFGCTLVFAVGATLATPTVHADTAEAKAEVTAGTTQTEPTAEAPTYVAPAATSPAETAPVEAHSATTAVSVDKSQLELVLAQAKAKNLDGQEASVKAEVTAAIAEAEALVANGTASQDQINQSVERLTRAVASVKEVTEATVETTTEAASEETTDSSETPKVRNRRATTEGTTRSIDESRLDRVTVTKDNFDSFFKEGGTANYDETSGTIKLTDDVSGQVGSAYLRFKIDPKEDFTFTGKVDIGDKYEGHTVGGRPGGDGVGFVFHTGNVDTIGQSGASIGMGTIKNAFGFKLDSWHNTSNPNAQQNASADPRYGGNAWRSNAFGSFYSSNNAGRVTTSSSAAKALNPAPSGQWVDFKIEYKGQTKEFIVTYGSEKWSTNLKTANASIMEPSAKTALNNSNATYALSFLGSTGSGTNLQRVQIEKFVFTAPQIVQVAFYDEAGNELAASSAIPGDRDQVVNLSNIEAVQKAITKIKAKGYTLKEVNSDRAETYNSGANTVTLRSGGQLLKYVFAVPSPAVTPTLQATGSMTVAGVKSTDNTLSGTGVPGATVTVKVAGTTLADNITVGPNGTWTTTLSKGFNSNITNQDQLVPKDSVTITQKIGVSESQATEVAVGLGESTVQPSTDSKDQQSLVAETTTVTLKVPHDAGITYFDYPNSSNGRSEVAIKRDSIPGAWTSKDESKAVVKSYSSDGFFDTVVLEMKDKIQAGKAKVISNIKETKYSSPTGWKEINVEAKPDTTPPAAPTVNAVKAGATSITGTAEANSKVEATLPNGSKVTATAGADGSFTIPVSGLNEGDTISVTATDAATNKSDATTVTVKENVRPTLHIPYDDPATQAIYVYSGEENNIELKVTDNSGKIVKAYLALPQDNRSGLGAEDTTFLNGRTKGGLYLKTEGIHGETTATESTPAIVRVTGEVPKNTYTESNGQFTRYLFAEDAAGNTGYEHVGDATTPGQLGRIRFMWKPQTFKYNAQAPSTPITSNTVPEASVLEKAIKDANPTFSDKIESVSVDGTNVKVTYKDGSTDVIPADSVFKIAPTAPKVTPVKNPSSLEQPEKDAVKKAVETANPTATKVEVGQDGTTTLTYSNGSTATLQPAQTVSQADVTAPAAPSVSPVTAGATAVTGTAEAGSTVEVTLPDGTKASAKADQDGNFSVPVSALKEGDKVSVTATDDAGNKSTPTSATVPDTTAPAAPSVSPVKAGDTAVTGTAEAGSTVEVTLPDGTKATAKADQDGNFSVPVSALKEGDKVSVTATDDAGNKSTPTSATVPDTTAPAAPSVSPVTAGATAVTGTAEAGSTVEVTLPDGSKATAKADQDGNFSVPVSALKEGDKVSVTATDDAGNKSTPTSATVPDTTAPAAPSVSPVTAGATAVTGTAEAGSTVEVTLPDGSKATAKADQDGNFSVPVSALKEGDKVSVTATDDAGNKSTPTSATVPDTTAPAAPSVSPVTAGATAVTGTAEAGSTVEVTLPDGTKATAKADQDGNFSVPVSALKEGDKVSVTATDDAGNKSTPTSATVPDTTAPAAPSVSPVTAGATAVTGTAEAGSTVEVTLPDGTKASAKADQDGNFSVPVSALKEGDKVSVTATDDAGNKSTPTSATVPDTTAPAAPSVSPVTAGATAVTGTAEAGSTVEVTLPDGSKATAKADQDGNFSVPVSALKEGDKVSVTATDDAGNKSTPTSATVPDTTAPAAPSVSPVTAGATAVTGTAEAGSTVEVTLPDGTKATAKADQDGNFSVPVSALKEGDKVSVTATDDAGNKSTPTSATVPDTTAPAAPSVSPVTAGATAVTGTAEAGSTVEVTLPDGTKASAKADQDGNFSVPVSALKEGDKVSVTATDDAGNKSTPTSATVPDTTAPAAPSVSPVTAGATAVTGTAEAGSTVEVTLPDGSKAPAKADQDGNFSVPVSALKEGDKVSVTATDDAGNKSTPTSATVPDTTAPAAPSVSPVTAGATAVTGTAEAGSTVEVTLPDGTKATAKADQDGNFSVPVSALKEGDKVSVTATDDAGNKSTPTSATVPDTTAPAAPSVSPVTAGATAVTGTAEAGSTVEVTLPDGSKATAKADQDGNFSVPVSALKEGDKVSVTATDDAGNKSTPTSATVPDTTAPAAPSVSPVTAGATAVTGTAEAGSTVEVTLPDGSKATAKADQDGNFSVPVSALKEGDKVSVTATDDAGNKSTPTSATVPDTTAPAAPSVSPVKAGDKAVTGTAEAGSTVEVTLPDGTKATATADKDGNFSVPVSGLEEGQTVSVTAKDASNNTSTPTTATVAKADDKTAPDAPVVNPVKAGDTAVTGTAEAGSTVEVTLPDGTKATATADKDGNFSVPVSGLEEGQTVSVTAKDASNNTSTPTTATVAKADDKTAPDAPVVNPVKAGDTAVTGTAEAGSTVEVTLPDGTKATATADKDGNFSVPVSGLEEGQTVSVTAKDASNNTSTPTTATVAKADDKTAPDAPVVNPVKAGDTAVTGTAEAGSTVEVTLPDGTKATATADKDGNFSVPVSGLEEGQTVSVTAKDASNNTSTPTTATVAKADDKTAPDAPVVNPVKAGDTAVTGTAEAGSTVEVTLPDGTKATATADKDGNFSVPVSGLEEGQTVSVTAKDASNNTSTPTTATVAKADDKTAPDAPVVNPVKAGDKAVTGTAEAGSTVEVTLPDGTKATATADKDGNFSVPVSGLEEGQTVSVTAKDASNNTSTPTTATVAKADDKTAPDAPVVNPVKAGDTAVTGTAEAGSTVEVTLPDGTKATATADKDGNFSVPVSGLEEGQTVSVTAKDASNNTSTPTTATVAKADDKTAPDAPVVNPVKAGDTAVTGTAEAGSTVEVTLPDGTKATATADQDGNFSVPVSGLEEGQTVSVTAKDASNNTSTPTTATVAKADDKTAPDAPVVNPVKAGDTAVTGTAEAGSTVEVTLPDGTKASATADQDGNFSVPVSGLEEGQTVSVTAKDASNNTSTPTTATVAKADDKTAPDAPVVNPVKAGDTAVTGTAEAGSTVEVTLPDGTKATATADKDGNFSVPVSGLEAGQTVSVTAKDASNNTSTPTTATVAKADDKTAPDAPVVNPVKAGDKAVTGTAEAGSTVEVTLPDGTKATATADKDGNFSVPVSGLEAGQTVSVTAKDASNNTSTPTTATVAKADDKTAPDAPVVNPVKAGDTAVTGTAEAGSTVEVTLPDGTKASATAGEDGTFSIPVAGLNENDEVSVTATDAANNTSAPTTATVAKADADSIQAPSTKTPVKDTANLTDAEKAKVKEAVEAANPGSKAEVGQDGTTKVTFPDGSTATLTGDQTVKTADSNGVQAPSTKTPVKDTANLTDAEKAKVKEAVEAANPGSKAEVGQDGTTKVTFPDGSTATLTGDQTVKAADSNGVKVPSTKTPVKDTANLTDAEKAKVKEAVEAANPGSKAEVGQDGTTTVTFPDGSTATLTGDQTVKAADANGAKVPSTKTPVKDTANLTDAEKAKVKEAVEAANPGSKAEVGQDGTTTVTFPDGSTATLTGDQTVKTADSNGVQVPSTKTPVKDTANLTDAEKAKVKEAVEAANPGSKAEVGQDGTTTVTFPDGSTATLTGDKTVTQADITAPTAPVVNPVKAGDTAITGTAEAGSTVEVTLPDGTKVSAKADKDGKFSIPVSGLNAGDTVSVTTTDEAGNTSATTTVTVSKVNVGGKDADNAKVPVLTPVVDPSNLTDAEKAKVAEEVKKVNPTAKDIKVNNDGSVVVTFADGSVATIAANKVVKEATKESSAQAPAKKAGAKELPNTGTKQSNASLGLALLAAVTGGLLISKKRKEEE